MVRFIWTSEMEVALLESFASVKYTPDFKDDKIMKSKAWNLVHLNFLRRIPEDVDRIDKTKVQSKYKRLLILYSAYKFLKSQPDAWIDPNSGMFKFEKDVWDRLLEEKSEVKFFLHKRFEHAELCAICMGEGDTNEALQYALSAQKLQELRKLWKQVSSTPVKNELGTPPPATATSQDDNILNETGGGESNPQPQPQLQQLQLPPQSPTGLSEVKVPCFPIAATTLIGRIDRLAKEIGVRTAPGIGVIGNVTIFEQTIFAKPQKGSLASRIKGLENELGI